MKKSTSDAFKMYIRILYLIEGDQVEKFRSEIEELL